MSQAVNMSQELLTKVCRDTHVVGGVHLLIRCFFPEDFMCFDLHVISTQVTIKIMDMNEIGKG